MENFKTKKALKLAVERYNRTLCGAVRCFQPGLGPNLDGWNGKICLEGPHYPKPHTWYAEAELKDGCVIKVK
jgi:hypothetical protein